MENDYDELYSMFKQKKEKEEQEHFNYFMSSLDSGLTRDLNKAYIEDKEHYERLLNNIKSKGIRVFRNKNGEYKLKFY